jgi:hypothetical protein
MQRLSVWILWVTPWQALRCSALTYTTMHIRALPLSLAIAMLPACGLAQAQPLTRLEVKGLRIGMTRAELSALGAKPWESNWSMCMPELTIGNVRAGGRAGACGAFILLKRNALKSFTFAIDSGYDNVKRAVASKFPYLQCVANSAGLWEEECSLSDARSRLWLAKSRTLARNSGMLRLSGLESAAAQPVSSSKAPESDI